MTILAHEISASNASALKTRNTISAHNKLKPLNMDNNNNETLLTKSFLSSTSFL